MGIKSFDNSRSNAELGVPTLTEHLRCKEKSIVKKS
jgi:hypothetical protein